ncbi:MAG: HlyC/CorC family transporter [Xanthobacteraceae bacterium]|nr:HlyC/CorC family transporter [Xanthobacteraceae bacterium]
MAVELIIVVLLVLLNGFLAMSEIAIISSRRTRLERLTSSGSAGARAALKLADEPGQLLAALQVGMTSIGILAGAFSGLTLADRVDVWLDQFPTIAAFSKPVAVVLVVIGVAYLSLVAGELAPKQIALKNPERIAVKVSRPILVFLRFSAPLVWLLNATTTRILGLFGWQPGFERRVTDEDIVGVLLEGEKAGLIHAAEREMVEDVLDLTDRPIRAIMTPRPDVVWINADAPQDAIARTIRTCPFPQLIVCHGTIDKVVGVVRKQDLLNQALDGASLDIRQELQPPLIVPERTSILRTLDLFRNTPVNTAIVVDEYGTVQGIVTRTDLLEAVAGRLPDIDTQPHKKVIRRQDGALVIDAATPIDDAVELLGLEGNWQTDVVTVAGLILSKLDHVPHIGKQLSYGGWRFEIADMDGARISQVLARPVAQTPEGASQP